MVSVSSTCWGSRNEASTGVMVKVDSQGAEEGEAVGSRHGAENLAFDALHGEQRHERRHRNQGGEENRLIDLQRAGKNEPQPIGPMRGVRRTAPIVSGRRQNDLPRVAAAGSAGLAGL